MKQFLNIHVPHKYSFSLDAAQPYHITEDGVDLTFENTVMHSKLLGVFNAYNILAAATYAHSQGIDTTIIQNAIRAFDHIPGRVQKIVAGPLVGGTKQNFTVVVDYAHTKESLEGLYRAFGQRRKICVLGNTGGGRDAWKRPLMGKNADTYCTHIILTNEDPYDEDPMDIICEVARAVIRVGKVEGQDFWKILDRREAIERAVRLAREGDIVLITGKGSEQAMVLKAGKKVPWDDREVARTAILTVRK